TEGNMRYHVHLVKRCAWDAADPNRTGFFPAVISANGRVKPNWVTINGTDVERKDGTYYLDWREDGKRKKEAVGSDALKANLERELKETKLNGKAVGMTPAPDDSRTLQTAIDHFLNAYEKSRKQKTFWAYQLALRQFVLSC